MERKAELRSLDQSWLEHEPLVTRPAALCEFRRRETRRGRVLAIYEHQLLARVVHEVDKAC